MELCFYNDGIYGESASDMLRACENNDVTTIGKVNSIIDRLIEPLVHCAISTMDAINSTTSDNSRFFILDLYVVDDKLVSIFYSPNDDGEWVEVK